MRRAHHRERFAGEHGLATAEFAVALPAVVLVLAMVVGMADVLLHRHRAVHAAAVGARVAARGEGDIAVQAAVRATGLTSASVMTRIDGPYVRVRVSLEVAGLGWALPPVSQEVVSTIEQAGDVQSPGAGAAG